MAYPLYYRSSNPGLASVTAKALNLFEWDGTGEMPTEIQNGKAFTPPAVIANETVIWSDTYTLGYTDQATAAPVFFSDGAAGAAKVLEMINHVAGRLNQALFVDLPTAKAWIATQQGVDFVEPGAGTPGVATNAYSINLDIDGNGFVIYHDGYLGGFSGGSSASAWPASTQISIARIDAFGIDRTADFQNATQIRVEVDASNYAVYNVSNVQLTTQVFTNGTYPFIQAYTATLAESAGLRPANQPYSVNPQFVTVSNPALAGTGTDYTETWSNGDITFILENNSAQSLIAWESTNSTGGSLLVSGVPKEYSAAAGTPWMPLLPGESFTATGLHRWNPSGTQLIGDGQTWSSSVNRLFTVTVNGVLVRANQFSSNSFGSTYFRAGNVSLQAGDTVRVVVTNP